MATKILLLLLAICFVPALVSASFEGVKFVVKGSVYYDTCNCGYETYASKYMPGSTVKIECRNRDTAQITYTSDDAVTGPNGEYTIEVNRDCGEDYCDAVLVKSAHPDFSTPNKGRDRALVILTNNNGIISNLRYANNMGFLANKPLPNCGQILRKYREVEV